MSMYEQYICNVPVDWQSNVKNTQHTITVKCRGVQHMQHTTCDMQLTMSVNGSTSSLQYLSSSDLKLKPPLRWTASEITERVFPTPNKTGNKDSTSREKILHPLVHIHTYVRTYIQHVHTVVTTRVTKLHVNHPVCKQLRSCGDYSAWSTLGSFTLSMQFCCY